MSLGMMASWQYPKISRRAFIAGMVYSAFPAINVKANQKKQEAGPSVVRGPYIQRAHHQGVVVMWYTDEPTSTQVRFGELLGATDQSYSVEGRRYRHIARINGLSSDTKYYYSVGTTEEVLSGGTEETYFITAPLIGQSKPTRIWALGDSGSPNDNMRRTRDSYLAYDNTHTDICLMLGDNAYPDGTEEEYHEAVFDMLKDQLCHMPLWPAYGNHDARCSDCVSGAQEGPFFWLFKLPTLGQAGGAMSGRYDFYSFDHGDIHFICLNSQDARDSHMLHWLQTDLAQNRSTWLIAYWHHPPYSKGAHDSDEVEELQYMRTTVLPLLETYGVDLVLTGHNHSYERSCFIHGHYGTSDTLADHMILNAGNGSGIGNSDGVYTKKIGRNPGTVYVSAGCASLLKDGPLNHPAMAVSAATIGSLVIDVDGYSLTCRFLTQYGDVSDSFQIEKIKDIFFPVHFA